jgi:hypothetical protein
MIGKIMNNKYIFCIPFLWTSLLMPMQGPVDESLYIPREVFGYIFSFLYRRQDLQAVRCVSRDCKMLIDELVKARANLEHKKIKIFTERFLKQVVDKPHVIADVSKNFEGFRSQYSIRANFVPMTSRVMLRYRENMLLIADALRRPTDLTHLVGDYVYNHQMSAYVAHTTRGKAIVDIESQKKVPLEHIEALQSSVRHVAFSTDDTCIALSFEDRIEVFESKTGKMIGLIRCLGSAPVMMKFHSRKALLLTTTGSKNTVNTCIVAWPLSQLNAQQEWSAGHDYTGTMRGSWIISPYGDECAILLDNTVYRWQIQPGTCPPLSAIVLQGEIGKYMRYSPDNRRIFIKKQRRFIGESPSLVVYDLDREEQLDLSKKRFILGLWAFTFYQKVSKDRCFAQWGTCIYDLRAWKDFEQMIYELE